ncbi:MAG: PD40 domain-containing protein [Verrucomicrobia bacterium]|nr:PD40 domain-containing protein [Verrucomicrobiota bacterium]
MTKLLTACWFSFALLGLLATGRPALAASKKFTLEIVSTPPGAKISIAGVSFGVTPTGGGPLVLTDYPLDDKVPYPIKAEKDGFASVERIITYADAKALAKGNTFGPKIWQIELPPMTEVRREIPVFITNAVPGATVFIDNVEAGKSPLAANAIFVRADATSAWHNVTIRLELEPQFRTEELALQADEVFRSVGTTRKTYEVVFSLLEIQRTYQLEISANESDAIIELDEKEIGRTGALPFRHALVFTRESSQAWPSHALKVHKKDWEYREPGKLVGKAAFQQQLTVEAITNAGKGVFQVKVTLANPTHYATPIRYFEIAGGKLKLVVTNALSTIDNKDGDMIAPGVFRTDLAKESLILSRMACLPPQPDEKAHIFFTRPKWETPLASGTNPPTPQLVSANIMHATEGTKEPIRSEDSRDTDPFVTADGRWLYYSSDRSSGFRHIWRVSLQGQIGVAKISKDDSYIHLEPAVSPDGQLLAYSARPANAPANVPFSIWLANEDGNANKEICEGRCPAWSHDGKQLAYVSQNKIFIMNADGSGSKEITSDTDAQVLYPVWAPGDKYIYYCSDVGKDKAGNRQFDLWRIHTEKAGEPLQVTSNDSLDFAPLIVGRRLYFFSNRGATGDGVEALKICYKELPPD